MFDQVLDKTGLIYLFLTNPMQFPELTHSGKSRELTPFQCFFVRNSQFFSAFSSTGSQYSAAVGSSHSFAEAVLILSFSLRRLECALHCNESLPKN
jgi:hypothetical protein